ncbi:MAG: hypothetical protein ABSB63_19050 [Spirochaetia bacterium]|jgi:hypothetical protein
MGADKQWVLAAPPDASGTSLLPARAASEEQARLVGNQSAGRVFFFLRTPVIRVQRRRS